MSSIDNSASIYQQLGLTHRQQAERTDNQLLQADFLKLLTAQLQRQDPLSPHDGGQFLSDLAQFSQVEGINALQNSMEGLSASLLSNRALEASILVGQSVMVRTSSYDASKSGTEVKGAVYLPSSTTNVKVDVIDSAGQTVASINLGGQSEGLVDFTWDGKTSSGDPAPSGKYEFRAQATLGEDSESLTVFLESNVDSVALAGDGSLFLQLDGLGEYGLHHVVRIS